jgi:UDP-GlcNAc3NAcA epimerase
VQGVKIVTVVGARPQFIKAAVVSRALVREGRPWSGRMVERLIHTGQHSDANMSQVFFEQLDLPQPHINLGIANLSHGAMTGRMLEALERVLLAERPDWVLVYGDTNSTLAAALAATKLHLPIAHVEAGLRSFNKRMPEEINRILTDRVSTRLFCPTAEAMRNLHAEGLAQLAIHSGDVMYDAAVFYRRKAEARNALAAFGVAAGQYVLCTVHRAENTDDPARFDAIMTALEQIASELPVLFPVHPRTRGLLERRPRAPGLRLLEPVSYLDMISLEAGARAICTDSGGVQKEAFFHRVPCLTLRDETEWVETVELGWNALCGADGARILAAWRGIDGALRRDAAPYGDGDAAGRILDELWSCS